MCIFSRWSTYNETQIDEKARLSSAPISFLFFGLTSRESDPSRGIQKNLSFLKMRRGWTWWGRHSHPYLPKVFMLSKVSGRLTPAVSGKKRPKGIKKWPLKFGLRLTKKDLQGLDMLCGYLGCWQRWRSVIWWSMELYLTACSEKKMFWVTVELSEKAAHRVNDEGRCDLADHGHQMDHCHPLAPQGGR